MTNRRLRENKKQPLESGAARRAEEALRQADAYNRSLIEASLDPLVTIGPDGRITDVNAATEAATGRKRSELIGSDFCDYFTEPDKAREGYEQVFREGVVRDFPLEIRNREGFVTPVLYNATLYRDTAGEVVGVFAAARDISERKRAERALQSLNAELDRRVQERTAQLQAANQELEAFVYSVSHDLRSPLVTVKTFVGYLENDMAGDDKESLTQDIKFINSAADTMKLQLDELLELSRIGRIETEPVRVSFMELVTEALNTLAGTIKEHQADIHLHDADVMLFGDRPRLCQVWQNLIENAVKYASNADPLRIELGVRQEGQETVFFVKDNGIGIDAQHHRKIFGIFEKLDTNSPGIGMGLSLIKRIVEKCGGRIWVESEGIGTGSCFNFTLPQVVLQS